MKRHLFFFLLLGFTILKSQNLENIEYNINKLTRNIPATTKYSVVVYDMENQKFIYKKNEKELLIPASNTKLFTTATALYLLGKNFQLQTNIYSDYDAIESDIIEGNIYLKGFGDPTFSDTDLDSLVDKIYNSGIRFIKGDIIGDESFFDNIYRREDWIEDERANVKLPPISALGLNRNRISVNVNTHASIGKKATISSLDKIENLEIINITKIVSRRTRPILRSRNKDNKIHIEIGGTFARKKSLNYTIEVTDPALFAASVLYSKLKAKGIEIKGIPKTGVTPSMSDLLCNISKPLFDVMALANKRSDNYVTECLFKSVGAFYSNKQGNSFYSTQAVLSFLNKNNIFDEGVSIVDGSGISRFNVVTALSIVQLLNKIHFEKDLYEIFYETLSISGDDGTLRARNSGISFRGKTGTLRGVTTLSGYLDTKQNSKLIVSILFEYTKNNATFYKKLQDSIIRLLNNEI